MAEVNIPIRFVSQAQEDFFNCTKRNQCFNSGYGAGKSYVACLKGLTLLTRFPGYRIAIGRYTAEELRTTTMQTFFKVCPEELYDKKYGGNRVDSRNYIDLINGSRVYWMHFKDQDLSSLKSLEINAAIIDQAEEVSEEIYLALDSRVGRWEDVEVPASDLAEFYRNNGREWPRNEFTGKYLVPSYMMILCNPPDEGELSWIWQRYHPESEEFQQKWFKTHFYVESSSEENKALAKETLEAMLSRDKEWVDRYVKGKFGKGSGQIHSISSDSILHVNSDWVQNFKQKAKLYRAYDHGQTSPACCLWVAAFEDIHVVYQEYYSAGKLVSEHRREIARLSGNEEYVISVADPDIFKTKSEKYGGFWTVNDEYIDPNVDAPILAWNPADNNELANRNRINELLQLDSKIKHPVTGKSPAPRLYFVARDDNNPQGCHHVIRETRAQKLEILDTINGRAIYSDDRAAGVSDHAYDPLRYYCSIHADGKASIAAKRASSRSFIAARNRARALRIDGYFDRYGLPAR